MPETTVQLMKQEDNSQKSIADPNKSHIHEHPFFKEGINQSIDRSIDR